MITPFRTWRLWLVLVALLALPVLTYWDTIFAHFGLRDDYAVLREVHEEPGKVTDFCASHARPIFGWISEVSLRHLSTIHDLQWARLWAALCAGLAAGGTTWVLVRQLRWRLATGALVGALVALLPGMQVLAGWGSCWGHLVGLILGIAGFAVVERGLQAARSGGRAIGVVGGWVLVVAGALTYQSNVLFYVVFIAAALPGLREESLRARLRWLGMHLAVVCAGLAGAYAMAKGLFASGLFAQSGRVAFEPALMHKFFWFLNEPLGNALSFLVINDDSGRTAGWHLLMAAVVLAVIGAGAIFEGRRHGRMAGWCWAMGLAGLPVLAYAVSLIAAEHWSTYRTIFALTGVLLVFFVHGLDHVAEWMGGGWTRWLTPVVLGLLVAAGFGLARRQAYNLIALPQIKELALIGEGARQVSPTRLAKVFVVTPDGDDSFAELTYADEFGSLSTASDWTPKEMLMDLLRERHPAAGNARRLFLFATGGKPPAAGKFDVVIDLDQGLEQEKSRQAELKAAGRLHGWSLFAAWQSLGVERGQHRWPVFALLGFGVLVLLGWRPSMGGRTEG